MGFPACEVEALNAARIAGKTDDEIRSLVTRLEAARKTPGADNATVEAVPAGSLSRTMGWG